MPTATHTPTTNRRAALRFGVAATLAGLTTPAIAQTDFVKPPPLPWRSRTPSETDAELIRVCHAFAEAEFANWYRYVTAPVDTADDDDALTDWDTYHRIIAIPAMTPAGWHAKALALVAWDREGYDNEETDRTPASTFLASLLRDMVAPARNAIIARCAEAYGPLPSTYTADGVWIGYSAEEKARIDAETAEWRKAREAKEAMKRKAEEAPMTRELAEEMLASRTRLRDIAEEIYQEALDQMAAFEVAA